jgi:hypothetical protein
MAYSEVSSPPRVEGGAVRRERKEERWCGVAKRSREPCRFAEVRRWPIFLGYLFRWLGYYAKF